MVLSRDTKDNLQAWLADEFKEGATNVYFQHYTSSKRLNKERVENVIDDISENAPTVGERGSNTFSAWFEQQPVLFFQSTEERWIVVYSSRLRDTIQSNLSSLDRIYGWIIKSWIPDWVLTEVYKEFCPESAGVNIERRWDPYWIYQRGSDIPDELQDYYEEHIGQFVEQEIKFNLQTPKGLVDDALREGVKDEILEKSELAETRFEVQIPKSEIAFSDGGILTDAPISEDQFNSARVQVGLEGEVVHSSGDPEAVYFLLDELDNRNQIYQELGQVTGSRDYERFDSGIARLSSYTPAEVLRLIFPHQEYDEEASIKLQNLFTVGQDDVELHGLVKDRYGKEFLAETYTVFDGGEADVLFTEFEGRPTVYIKPRSTSTAGLVYIFWKLKQKFDPRVEKSIEPTFPEVGW